MTSHRSQHFALRPNDDGVTYQTTFTNLGLKGLANLSGWTAFGAFVDVVSGARTYDNLACTIGVYDATKGAVAVTCVSPAAPITAGKYRLEITMVSPANKKISSPSPDQDQTFIEIRALG